MSNSKQDLLIEIGTEELPPGALSNLSVAFEKLITEKLADAQLSFGDTWRFATPRRLALLVEGLDTQQKDRQNTRFGPAVKAAFDESGAPTRAALGFARSCGVEVDALQRSDKDGVEKLSFTSTEQGSTTAILLPDLLKQSLHQLPVPKRMRWGTAREEFVRPVHWLVFLFGEEVIPATLFGIEAGRQTMGHRFMHNEPITLSLPREYPQALEDTGSVIADFDKRRGMVKQLVREEAEKLSATPMLDEDLLDEVAALVEFPVALTGDFDPQFLEIPPEALILTMKSHQKCFCVTDEKGQLLPKFIAVSNLVSKDPQKVIEGNERVIRPRLADARFFFETDKQQTLESRIPALENLKFQDRLGSVYDKTRRVEQLAVWIAGQLAVDPDPCQRAALLSKSDLLTHMVNEFADLQGLMGYYYALHDGEAETVAVALNEQYQPRYAGAPVPASETGAVLALADKIDTMVGMFGIGQPPTGSKDPFALRRAALGVLRILVEKSLDLNILDCIKAAVSTYEAEQLEPDTVEQVFEFVFERFRAWYGEEGISTDVFLSVQAVKPERPMDFHLRIQAVSHFKNLPEAEALAAANKRVSNLLAKQPDTVAGQIDSALLTDPEEKALYADLQKIAEEIKPLLARGDYTLALQTLARLRDSVDAFFDQVLVMTEDPKIQGNRLGLLAALREQFLKTADISHLHAS